MFKTVDSLWKTAQRYFVWNTSILCIPFNKDVSTIYSRPLMSCTIHKIPSICPPGVFVSSRSLSRAINIALKRRPKKLHLPSRLRLIDEDGTNLGIMSSDIALKLADSKNLKLVEVKKQSDDSDAVYRLYTSKQQWEEAKKKKKAAKCDPVNTKKDITIFSQIGEHDLAVKMSHLIGFLERGHSARVFVRTKYRHGINEEREERCRREMIDKICSELEGLGEKVTESPHQRRGIACQFRPVRK